MPSSRIQRKIISSWMDEPRRKNYPQTYSRSMLKAMASVDIPEAHWQDLARDEVLWNKHVRQTDEDRDAQRQALFELHYDKDPAHHARILALSAFPVSQDQPPMSPFSPTVLSAGPGSLVRPSPRSTPWLEGPLSTPVVSSKGTPISTRRRDYVLGGGSLAPKQLRGKALHAKAVDQLDFRSYDPRNCLEPGKRRDRMAVSSREISSWTVRDVEAIHAQFFLDVGHGPKDLREVRMSQSGVCYWRLRQQETRPTHRCSWMNPRDDVYKGRNPATFLTRSSGPSFIDVDNEQHPPTLARCGHKDFSTPLRPTALSFVPISERSMVFDLSPPRSPPPPVPMGEVDPILSLDPDYLRQCSAQEAGDFLASLSLDTIIE